jgi:hypothetical protein
MKFPVIRLAIKTNKTMPRRFAPICGTIILNRFASVGEGLEKTKSGTRINSIRPAIMNNVEILKS